MDDVLRRLRTAAGLKPGLNPVLARVRGRREPAGSACRQSRRSRHRATVRKRAKGDCRRAGRLAVLSAPPPARRPRGGLRRGVGRAVETLSSSTPGLRHLRSLLKVTLIWKKKARHCHASGWPRGRKRSRMTIPFSQLPSASAPRRSCRRPFGLRCRTGST